MNVQSSSVPVIEVRHLRKSFGDNEVLHDISLSVEKGEVVSVIGSSGSGKSTMLRCINLLETPTGGDILFNGRSVLEKKGIRKITGPLSAAAAGKELSPAERSDIYSGSLLGGIAISVTGTCFPHNVGYYLTESRGLPHGFACAVFMEDLLRFELGICPEYASALFRDSGTSFDKLSALAAACLAGSAAEEISMSKDEIGRALPRWENAGSVKNTVGSPGTDFIEAILKNHFIK